jgi:putative NADH-flavin reductase
MKLVVFGATGGIGSQVIEQALAAGHEVTAVARHPSAVTIQHERLEVIQGDVLQPDTIHESIAGKDAVVSALGVRDFAPTTVYSEGVANIMQAMQSAHVRRILCISASGLDPAIGWQRLAAKLFLWRLLRNMYTDLVRMESELKTSGLDWTILRPPRFTNGPRTGRYQVVVNQQLSHGWRISRADIADYIVNHLNDRTTYSGLVELAY